MLRRARPTLRTLREDLRDGWASPQPRRRLAEGDISALQPLAALPHVIVEKAAESFDEDPDRDNFVGPIASAKSLRLLEIKAGQWRGGVWVDDSGGPCWLVIAGLAKGEHEDWGDFYQYVERLEGQGRLNELLPDDQDKRLWKTEVAAHRIVQWELSVQHEVANALRDIHSGGSRRLRFAHPLKASLDERDQHLADVSIEIQPVRERDYTADEVLVEVSGANRWAGSSLLWQLTVRILISLNPPEQSWDRFQDTFSNIAEPGTFKGRSEELDAFDGTGELAQSEPGTHAHYAHRRSLAERTVNGHAARSLCGVYFVPRQDHQSLPVCGTCETRAGELEAVEVP